MVLRYFWCLVCIRPWGVPCKFRCVHSGSRGARLRNRHGSLSRNLTYFCKVDPPFGWSLATSSRAGQCSHAEKLNRKPMYLILLICQMRNTKYIFSLCCHNRRKHNPILVLKTNESFKTHPYLGVLIWNKIKQIGRAFSPTFTTSNMNEKGKNLA